MSADGCNSRAYLAALDAVLADVRYAQLARSNELVRLARDSIGRVLASRDPLIFHAETVTLRAVARERQR